MDDRPRFLDHQDGNYPDFITGQRTDFALEFASRGGLRRLDEAQEVGVQWIAGSHYEVTAQVVHDEPNAQVLDFGILAYHFIGIEDPEHQSQVGAWVTGEITLSVDPFFYFEELASEDGFPALIYAWTVQEVLQKTGGFTPQAGPDHVRADKTHGFVRVEKTDAWVTSASCRVTCSDAEWSQHRDPLCGRLTTRELAEGRWRSRAYSRHERMASATGGRHPMPPAMPVRPAWRQVVRPGTPAWLRYPVTPVKSDPLYRRRSRAAASCRYSTPGSTSVSATPSTSQCRTRRRETAISTRSGTPTSSHR